jgi:hypothetical protein
MTFALDQRRPDISFPLAPQPKMNSMRNSHRENEAEPRERLLRRNHCVLKNLSTVDEERAQFL